MQPVIFHLGRDPGEKFPIRSAARQVQICLQLLSRKETGEGSESEVSARNKKREEIMGNAERRVVCLLVVKNVYEINADSVAYKGRQRIDPLSRSTPDYTLLFVIANGSGTQPSSVALQVKIAR